MNRRFPRSRSFSLLLALLAWLPCGPVAAQRLDPATEIAPFARETAKEYGLDEQRVEAVLADARVLQKVIDAISRPAEGKPWRDYRPIFLTEPRIESGVDFWKRHEADLARARAQFGVAERYIVAIIGVETFYGTRTGSLRVLDSLATLGFRYPRRAAFFRRELGQYLALGQQEDLDLHSVQGSYAGAMGIPQFIPSSYRAYAVDFDGDGRRDLMGSTTDAIGSVAAYLSRHGWEAGGPVAVEAVLDGRPVAGLLEKGTSKPSSSLGELHAAGVMPAAPVDGAGAAALIELDGTSGPEYWLGFNNFYVITRYNRSPLYAMAVFQLGEAIAARRAGGG